MDCKVFLSPKASVKGDREAITLTMKTVYQKSGALTPDAVVAEAKKKSSPLHGEFEWDDKVAAAAHRRSQALYLIRHVQIQMVSGSAKEKKPIHRLYVPVANDREQYIDVRDALQDSEAKARYVGYLIRKLDRLVAELQNFEEFVEVISAIRSLKRVA